MQILFERVAFIGIGLIGSSMARAMRRDGTVNTIVACARRAETRETALRLKVDEIEVALARIDDGSYGRCDECYEPISKPRLQFQLPVFTCVTCRASV